MSKPKKKTFYVQAKINVFTTLEVAAETLEDALEQGRTLKTVDFIEFTGDHIDSDLEICGVYE